MKKKTMALLTAIWMFLVVTGVPVFASEEDAQVSYRHVVDVDGGLKEKHKAAIEKAAEQVYEENGVEVYTYLTASELSDPAATGVEIYENAARTDAGIILMYDAQKIYIYTFGRCDSIFSDEELQDIMAQANAETSYAASFLKYVSMCSGILTEHGTKPIPSERQQPRLVDHADLLSDSEESRLLEKLNTISETHEVDVVIVTENSLNGVTSIAYADDFYDYNGYGFHLTRDGILLLISMENRDWAISTCGEGIPIFTDAGQSYMTDRFVSYLSDGDYYGGFDCFADLCEQFIGYYQENGAAYDIGNLPKNPFGWGLGIFVSLLFGGLVGFISVSVMKSQLKSVRVQDSAANYAKQGSLKITEKKDMFLYHVVNRTAKPRDDDSSGGGGGGSSTHSSSSGSSHGGSSGHF